MVDENAREPITDSALHDRRGNRRVDATGQPADRALAPDLRPDPLDLLFNDVDHRPRRPASGDVVQEVLEHLLTVRCVDDLGVELHPGKAATEILERGDV